jgi:DNA repair exonuclease SbcCD nuclease subunit
MNAIGIGDLHLTDSRGVGGLAAYIKDHDAMVARAVKRCLKWASQRGIRNVFLYGDLCEGTRMSYEAQLAMLRILREDFDFHIILGNHDLFAEDPALGHSLQLIQEFGLPNVHIYQEPTTISIEGRKVKFLPWPHVDFDPKCLNVAHVDVAGAKTDSGRPIAKGSESKATVVVGHIHTQQIVRNTHYSGTLYQTNFGEAPSKGFHHIEYDGGWVINQVPVTPEYRLHTVEVRTRRDLKAVPRSEKDLVKLILTDGCQLGAEDTVGINVVSTKTANGAKELALARVEDLLDGSEVELSSDEFFQEWLSTQAVDTPLKDQAIKLRTQTLKALTK